MKTVMITASIALASLYGTAVLAQGNKTGHTSDTQTQSLQGNSGKEARAGHPSQGTQTETTTYTGPPGQISKENFDHQNVDRSDPQTSGPGVGNQ
jgi:hypothetical protein